MKKNGTQKAASSIMEEDPERTSSILSHDTEHDTVAEEPRTAMKITVDVEEKPTVATPKGKGRKQVQPRSNPPDTSIPSLKKIKDSVAKDLLIP